MATGTSSKSLCWDLHNYCDPRIQIRIHFPRIDKEAAQVNEGHALRRELQATYGLSCSVEAATNLRRNSAVRATYA